jgi:3'(2'), 5'-bisphosphate nucleotidase
MSAFLSGADQALLGKLARAAGAIVMGVYRGEDGNADFGVEYKDAAKSDPVTRADQLANAYLVEALAANFPGVAIVSEEGPDTDAHVTGKACFFVDPLDGTIEFVRRTDSFCVMIGLVVDNIAHYGVVYEPVQDRLTFGGPGYGSRCQLTTPGSSELVTELLDLRSSVSAAEAKLEEASIVLSKNHFCEVTRQAAAALRIGRTSHVGSAGVKAVSVARGEADLVMYARFAGKRWDVAAPDAIVSGAGGKYTDFSGDAFDYRAPNLVNKNGILGGRAALHQAALERLLQAGAFAAEGTKG